VVVVMVVPALVAVVYLPDLEAEEEEEDEAPSPVRG